MAEKRGNLFFQFSKACDEISKALMLFLTTRGTFKNHENIVKDYQFRSVPLIFLKETHTS